MAEASLSGPVNAVAPETRSQADFARAMAASFGRRVWLRMPGAPLRWALGEMSELLLQGQNVVPRAALDAGFRFEHPTLVEALGSLATAPRK
jgi:NAD dependent epimerase/dehydratase family enzyme